MNQEIFNSIFNAKFAGQAKEKLSLNALETLPMWTVYDNPKDVPGHFVARRFVYDRALKDYVPTQHAFAYRTIEQVRAALPKGLIRIPRYPSDDPHVVEVWM